VPQNNTNASGKFYSFVIDDTSLGSDPEFLIQYNTGNVGIGTAFPGKLFQVGGPAGTEGMIRLASASTNRATRTWDIGVPQNNTNASGKFYSFVIDDTSLGSDPEFLIQYNTGNVGIGTTNPVSKLHVAGSGNFDGTLSGNGDFRLRAIEGNGSNGTAFVQ